MKKVLVLLPIMLLCLTGCGEKSGTIKCELSTKDVVNGYEVTAEYNIYYTGDLVDSVKTTEVVTSTDEDILSQFEDTLNDTYSVYNDTYGGYTYKVDRTDGKVTSNVTIDYEKMDLEQFVEDQPTLKSFVKDNKLLVEGLKASYEEMGATCE